MIKLILLLGLLDVTLTHYQFFLDKKKDAFDARSELMWLPRKIMNNNPNPYNYLLGVLITCMIYSLSVWYPPVQPVLLGLLGVANYTHIANIGVIKKNWDNDAYWMYSRAIKKVMK